MRITRYAALFVFGVLLARPELLQAGIVENIYNYCIGYAGGSCESPLFTMCTGFDVAAQCNGPEPGRTVCIGLMAYELECLCASGGTTTQC